MEAASKWLATVLKNGKKCMESAPTGTYLVFFGATKPIDYACLSLYYKTLRFVSLHLRTLLAGEGHPVFSVKMAVLRSDNALFPRLGPVIAARLSIVFISVFAACSFAFAADVPAANPRIQGGNIRIEFDNHLRSRVVACFNKKETVLGPFTASETATTGDQAWAGFLM